MITLSLLVVFFCVFTFHVLTRYNKSGRMYNKIPGPPPLPLIGNMLHLNCSAQKVFVVLRELADEYYPIFRLWFMSSAAIGIRHPDDIKTMLLTKINFTKSTAYENMKYCEIDGLVTSIGKKWHQRRKILSPAFSPRMMKRNAEIISKHVEKFIGNLKSLGKESVIDLQSTFTRVTINMICETTLGVNLEESGIDEEKSFRDALQYTLNVCLYRALRPYIKDWMMPFLPVGRKQDRLIKASRVFTHKVVEERRKYHERTGYIHIQDPPEKENDKQRIAPGRRQLAAIDLLLLAEKEGLVDDRGIREELETFISAGFDTTGLAMCHVLMLLAENKEAQDLARAEVRQIYKQNNGEVTPDDILNLDYIDRCIKESLRLFASAPKIGRILSEEVTLSNYRIPADSEVIILINEVHRDPNYWPDPIKFDPDRFLPDEVEKRYPFSYIPFSEGPRKCIGFKYATMTLKLLLAPILYNFYLEPVQSTAEIQYTISITLQPAHPIHVKFVQIEH